MATTRWRDNVTTEINNAISLLVDSVANDDRSSGISRENWMIRKNFDDNKVITLFENDLTYNVVRFSYDKTTLYGSDPNSIPKNGFIIVYSNKQNINYIIDKNSDAKLILRKLLSYTGKNEIDENGVHFDSDFFLWLINRVYYTNNTIETEDETGFTLELQSIKGFSGDTEDSQTKVSASGESVMNIISTLSFFLESRKLKQIRLELKYKTHEKIELILKNGTLEVDFKSYLGSYDVDQIDERIAKLYLMAYIEIVPILIQEYQTDIENDLWNKDRYVEFMNNVADTLKEKIEEKTKAINEGLPDIIA